MTQASILTPEPEVFASEIVSSTDLARFVASEEQIAKLFSVSDALIATLKAEFAPVTWDSPKNYEIGTKALRTLRELRVGVAETHKELKADSLSYGRKCDAVKKRFTEMLEEIEAPLIDAKSAVDTEKARIKAEKEAAEKAAVEAQIRAEREAEQRELDRQRAELESQRLKLAKEREEYEAREQEAREAREAEEIKARQVREAAERAEQAKRDEAARIERERVEAQQKAERDRLAAERRKLEEEQKAERERAAAERQKVEEERRAVEREKDRLAREGIEQAVRERTERETRERIAREQKEAEEARVALAEREAAALARLEALRPDREKLRVFARQIRTLLESVQGVAFSTPEATDAYVGATEQLDDTAVYLEAFGSEGVS